MDIAVGAPHIVRNKRSGLVLSVRDRALASGARLEIRPLNGDDASQLWYVFALDGAVLLANKASGHLVRAGDDHGFSDHLEQHSSTTGSTHLWRLRKLPGDGGVHLVNKSTTQLMNVRRNSVEPGSTVEMWRKQGPAVGAQAWSLEVHGDIDPVVEELRRTRTASPTDIGDVLRLSDYKMPASDRTEEVLVGQVLLPFPLVQDRDLTARQRADETPWYVLRRYAYWHMVYYFEHSGASDHTRTKSVTVGMTSSNFSEVHKTTGISVTADAAFGYWGLSAALGTTIGRDLKVTRGSSSSESTTSSETVTRSYPAGKRVADAVWFRENRYVLSRLDGETVVEWTVRDPDINVVDSHPDPV
ncbi:RICIN domain-containing protein [Nocardiopsis sp. NPDC101807]|uniref:RICIN domain-containing protein n=1 Tax=Nocardiopsis sp. NPDC101807 TaxID=3364339 RepID=UPI00381F5AA9